MPEDANIEIAHKLSEPSVDKHRRHSEELLEVVEVFLLAIIAIATAWSGYEAARWDGQQALRYGEAIRDRFAADAASTLSGQRLVANSSIFTAWLTAKHTGMAELQRELERRFTPEYRASFEAWLATDPDHNPDAPPGPGYMPLFREPGMEEAKRLNERATATFEVGTRAREIADKYVRDTVRFATVLFVVGIAQRFKLREVRIAATLLAVALLLYALITMSRLPRL
jgi:hypothetical protein